jgi:hypothetical protein
MRDDFCAFILTHGRPNKIYTYEQLKNAGYTGKVFIVIDDEDKTAEEYKAIYGEKVLTFEKSKIAKTFDEGDNFNDRRAIIYARNACFDLAKKIGCKYFIQLDDDYTNFHYRFDHEYKYWANPIYSLDQVFNLMIEYLIKTPFATIAMGQGGDYIGGSNGRYAQEVRTQRKAMNTFVCSIDKPFQFFGRINEDVNVYTCAQRRGLPVLTIFGVSINQKQTQSNTGGMTELYLDAGTYVKSFYSVMYAPSCVTIKDMGELHRRLHHSINWNSAAPLILRRNIKK